MRKIIVFFLFLTLIIAIGLGIVYLNEANRRFEDELNQNVAGQQTSNQNYRLNYYTNPSKDVYLVEFKDPISLIYNPNPTKTAREISLEENFIISTNGGYFNESKNYAGLLIQNGVLQNNISLIDKQVTGVVVLKDDFIEFKSVDSIDIDNYLGDESATVFQTGPILIWQNSINNEGIEKSVNGSGKYFRTVLGYTLSGKKFIAVTTELYDLKTLAAELLKMDNLKGETINVINLDGGSSTYIYSSENKDFNIGTFKTLPVILGVKDVIP